MGAIIFDRQGRVWDARSPKLAQHLGSSIAGKALVDYVVRNMGYVAAETSGTTAHVRLRPAIAAPGAVRALLYWLRDRHEERVVVSKFEKGWRHELMPWYGATARLVAMTRTRRAA